MFNNFISSYLETVTCILTFLNISRFRHIEISPPAFEKSLSAKTDVAGIQRYFFARLEKYCNLYHFLSTILLGLHLLL